MEDGGASPMDVRPGPRSRKRRPAQRGRRGACFPCRSLGPVAPLSSASSVAGCWARVLRPLCSRGTRLR